MAVLSFIYHSIGWFIKARKCVAGKRFIPLPYIALAAARGGQKKAFTEYIFSTRECLKPFEPLLHMCVPEQ